MANLMLNFIYNVHTFFLFLILCAISISFSFASIYLIKRHIHISTLRLYEENEVIGYLGAIVGIIYAMLVGFTTLHVLENFNLADDSITIEAQATAKVYYDAGRFPPPTSAKIRQEVKHYLETVIFHEWPSMAAGKDIQPEGSLIINKLFTLINEYQPQNPSQALAINTVYEHVEDLYNAHLERADMGDAAIRKDVWLILIVTAILTLSCSFFFGIEKRLHALLITALSITIAATIFIVLVLDRPFRGDFSASPDPLQTLLTEITYHP